MITTSELTVEKSDSPNSWDIFLPVVPVPASRPRMARKSGRVYYGKRYTEFRRDASSLLNAYEWPVEFPLDGMVAVAVTFYVPRPKTTKRKHPRGDVDNYFKTLDVLNEMAWWDDDQIVWASMAKEFSDEAGIGLEVKQIDSIPKTRKMSDMRF